MFSCLQVVISEISIPIPSSVSCSSCSVCYACIIIPVVNVMPVLLTP